MSASVPSPPVTRPLTGLAPARVLGALASLPGAFWLETAIGTFAGALPIATSDALDPDPALLPVADGQPSDAVFPRWVGVLPYEAARARERTRGPDQRPAPLLAVPAWRKYDAAVRFDAAGDAHLLGRDEAAVGRLYDALRSRLTLLSPAQATLKWDAPPELEEVHERRIVRALEHIARGDLYQVNLARRFAFRGGGHPFELLVRLLTRGRDFDELLTVGALPPHAAGIDGGHFQVISTSPESFLELGPGGFVATRPIKGTRPRHPDPVQDRLLAEELDGSEKERAELAMVIDLERNDLGRLARPGSVRLVEPPTVVSLATVHHRQALVTAELSPGVSRAEVLSVMLPSGSVTGAPKVRAMDLIRELESHRRGLYTGALGALYSDGRLELSMAIRCLLTRGGETEYWSGGGIVADSDPKREVEETLWKAEQLSGLLNGSGL